MIKPTIQELTTLPKGENKESRIVKAVSPLSMNIMVPKADDDSYSVLARITWLCKDIYDCFFCLTTTYVSESDEDDEFLALSPLSAERYFVNYNVTSDLLASSLPHYLTNLDVEFLHPESIHRSNDVEISCQAYEKVENGEDKLHKLMFTPEVFSTMMFVDDYFLTAEQRNADLHSAILFGADQSSNTFIFEVNDIEVLEAAMYDKDNLVVRTKISHTGKSNQTVEFLLIAGCDKSKKILKKEIKKKAAKEITDNYMIKDENQFIQRFSFDFNIGNNRYLFTKAVNVNKDGLLFAFSPEVQSMLSNKITEFVYKSV